jgi:hypothetical protein
VWRSDFIGYAALALLVLGLLASFVSLPSGTGA